MSSQAVGLSSTARIVWGLGKRDLKTRYASSWAGALWNVAVPLINAFTLMMVFSILMAGKVGVRYNEAPFLLFFFVPFMLWQLFTDIISRSTTVLREHSYLITKIAFPVVVLPLVPVLSALLTQLILAILLGVFFVYYGVLPGPAAGYFVIVWLCMLLLAIGLSYGLSALSAYFPDLAQLVPLLLGIVFWLTPLLYPASVIEKAESVALRNIIMHYNPLYYFVEGARDAILANGEMFPALVPLLAGIAVVALLFNIPLFLRLRHGFADVI